MYDYFTDTATLVHGATATYVLGFLFRNQIILRSLVLLGTILYILYYYHHTEAPLWDAIIGSVLIGVATVIGMGLVIYSRIPIGMNKADRELFDSLGGGLEPGEFRELMRVGRRRDTTVPVELTREGDVPGSLYFVISGSPMIRKGVASFRINNQVFIGEVGFFLDVPASATVMLPAGGEFIEWQRSELEAMLERKPQLERAFNSLITRDLATKVKTGLQPTDLAVMRASEVHAIAISA